MLPSSPTVENVSASRRRRTRLVLAALSCIAVVVITVVLWAGEQPPRAAPEPPREAMVDVLDGPNDDQRVQIDVTLYAPAETPAPAILLAHGFGGSKADTAAQARELVQRGFTVLTYSAAASAAAPARSR